MSDDREYMPVWLYNFISASMVHDYMVDDHPLPVAAAKYARYYSDKYAPIELTPLVDATEEIIMFIASLNVDDPLALIDFYRFYCLNFEDPQTERNRDSFFGDIFEGTAGKGYSYDLATKSFKAYTFKLRSNQIPVPSEHWELKLETGEEGQVEDLVKLTETALTDEDYKYAAQNEARAGAGG